MALVVLLAAAMGTATFIYGAISVLASDIIDELDLTRSQLGVVFMAFSLTGALTAPLMGRLTDVSVRRVMAALFGAAAAALLIAAAAPTLLWLVVATAVGGLALAASNPATNKIVSERISTGRRGIVIGIKQAGVWVGLLLAGLLLPPLALAVGWRWAVALTVVLPLLALVSVRFLMPGSDSTAAPAPTLAGDATQSTRLAVVWLAVIGSAVAMCGGATLAFVPLYAQEAVGLSAPLAGLLASTMGLTGMVANVVWGGAATRFRHTTTPLLGISMVGLVATVAIGSGTSAVWLLWLGVILFGASMMAWHSVAWLALLNIVDAAGIGRASGRVQVGNSLGFMLGPPLAGVLIDATGTYAWAWTLVAGLFALSAVMTVAWRRAVE